MKDKIKTYAVKILCLAMSVQIFNISIDIDDYILFGHNVYGYENPKTNQIHSFYELITEVILKMGDVVPERDQDISPQFLKDFAVFFNSDSFPEAIRKFFTDLPVDKNFFYKHRIYKSFVKDVIYPPPEKTLCIFNKLKYIF